MVPTHVEERERRHLLRLARQTPLYRGKLADHAQARLPFASVLPPTSVDQLVAARRATDDPFGGRLRRGSRIAVMVQLEEPADLSLYVALSRSDLNDYARALRHALALLGAGTGQTIVIYDYGSSPVTYLASRFYTAYLRQGAADALGCTVVCNDGGANMAARAAELLGHIQSGILLVRSDCVDPLLAACEAMGISLERHVHRMVVTQSGNPRSPARREALAGRSGVPVSYLYRADTALFLAAECPDCLAMHVPEDLYLLEVVHPESHQALPPGEVGQIVITSRFARACPVIRILTHLTGRVLTGHCPRAPDDLRVGL